MEILKESEKILVIQTAFLGDAILSLPMIQKIKEIFPYSIIDVVAIPQTKEVFESSPYVNKVYSYDKRGNQKSIFYLIKFAKQLKQNKYTHLYSPHRSLRTSILVNLLSVENSVGFDNSALSFVYKKNIKYEDRIHEVARNLKLIGIKVINEEWKIIPELKSSTEIQNRIDNEIKFVKNPIIAIAPGSVWQTKKYPEEYFEKINDYLIGKNYFVVFIGSKSDYELCNRLSEKINDRSINYAGKLNVIESVELLRRCKLLICNDSAPTHMGMAADIPVLTLYCSTVPEFGFYPYNNKSMFLSFDDLDCKPCGIHGQKNCPIKSFDCGYKLNSEKVIEKIEEILSIKAK